MTCRQTVLVSKREAEDSFNAAVVSGQFDYNDKLTIAFSPTKKRKVLATSGIARGTIVVSYAGELLTGWAAIRQRELEHARADHGCYMFIFRYNNQTYCVDATAETGTQGRLINHSVKEPNVLPMLRVVGGGYYILFKAIRDIEANEELLYDYQETRKEVVAVLDFLTNS